MTFLIKTANLRTFSLLFLFMLSILLVSCEKEALLPEEMPQTLEQNDFDMDLLASSKAAPPTKYTCNITGPAVVTQNQSGITYAATAINGASYTWTVTGSLTIIAQSGNTITVAANGINDGNVCVQITYAHNGGTCTINCCLPVTCNPAPCTVDLEEIIRPCGEEGGPGNFNIRGHYGATLNQNCLKTVDKYAWTVNDGSLVQTEPEVHYLETANGNVWFTPDASCHLNWLTVSVTVHFTDGSTATDSETLFLDCDD